MDLLNVWNLYNIYSFPPFPLQLQTLFDPSRAEQEVGRQSWFVGCCSSVFPCQPLTYCTSHCYAPLATIHAALDRDVANTLKLPVYSVRCTCWMVEQLLKPCPPKHGDVRLERFWSLPKTDIQTHFTSRLASCTQVRQEPGFELSLSLFFHTLHNYFCNFS